MATDPPDTRDDTRPHFHTHTLRDGNPDTPDTYDTTLDDPNADITQPRPSYILGKSAPPGGSLQRAHLRAFLLGKLGFQVPGTGQTPQRTVPPVLPPTEADVDLWLDEIFGGDDPAPDMTSLTPYDELHTRATQNQQEADERAGQKGAGVAGVLDRSESTMTDTDTRHPKHARDLNPRNPNRDRENLERHDAAAATSTTATTTQPSDRDVLRRPTTVTTEDGSTVPHQPGKGKTPMHGDPAPEPEVRKRSNL
jgi:hypothetical protein